MAAASSSRRRSRARIILDLGSGSGQDAFLLAQLVGEHGRVTGVDATPAQLAIANRHLDWHRERFGYAQSNVRFVEGDIERLDALDLPEAAYRRDRLELRHQPRRRQGGGAARRASPAQARRRTLLLRRLCRSPRARRRCSPIPCCTANAWLARFTGAISCRWPKPPGSPIRAWSPIDHWPSSTPNIAAKLDGIAFHSATYRLFKLDGLEAQCEDYGQAVRYRGTVPGSERVFHLDGHHAIEAGRLFPVCGNTWKMLAETRFAAHFDFVGDFSRHFGVFAGCGVTSPFGAGENGEPPSAGCC